MIKLYYRGNSFVSFLVFFMFSYSGILAHAKSAKDLKFDSEIHLLNDNLNGRSFLKTQEKNNKIGISFKSDYSLIFTQKNGYRPGGPSLFSPAGSISICFQKKEEKNKMIFGISYQQQYFQTRNPTDQYFTYGGTEYNYKLIKKWRYNFIGPELGFAFKLSSTRLSYIIPYVFLGISFHSFINYDYSPDYNISPYIDSKDEINKVSIIGFGFNYLMNIKSFEKFSIRLIISSRYRYIDIEDEINLGLGIELKFN